MVAVAAAGRAREAILGTWGHRGHKSSSLSLKLSSSSERFFPFTAGEHALMATSNSWFWKYSESKGEGVSTISPTAVSFDGLKLKDMFRYDIWLHCARGGKAD